MPRDADINKNVTANKKIYFLKALLFCLSRQRHSCQLSHFFLKLVPYAHLDKSVSVDQN